MHDLIQSSIDAHGGLDSWKPIRQVSATLCPGGPIFKQRGQEAFTQMLTRVTVDTREQNTAFEPFLASGQRGIFEPFRTAVESLDGTVLSELQNPRESFKAMAEGTPWSACQLGYFLGYALSMYFTVPFSLLMNGIECQEVEPWMEDGEKWRALKVKFPKSYISHSAEQTFYFDENGLIRRHDYTVEISHDAKVAHYLYDHRTFDGIVFPTRRRVYLRGPDLKPQKQFAVISVDLSDFRLSRLTS